MTNDKVILVNPEQWSYSYDAYVHAFDALLFRDSHSANAFQADFQKKGIRYERLAGKRLASSYGGGFTVRLGPWVTYKTGSKPRFCQPDGLVEGPDCCVVVEFKLSHRPEAEAKLRNFYLPILSLLYPPGHRFKLVQICKNLRLGDRPTRIKLPDLINLTDEYSLVQWIG